MTFVYISFKNNPRCRCVSFIINLVHRNYNRGRWCLLLRVHLENESVPLEEYDDDDDELHYGNTGNKEISVGANAGEHVPN